jgi:hypothetical protein
MRYHTARTAIANTEQRVFGCDALAGLDLSACCTSCHEEDDAGLSSLAEVEMPDGLLFRVCCKLSGWLQGITAQEWTCLKMAAKAMGMGLPEYCWACDDWHTGMAYLPETLDTMNSLEELAQAADHLQQANAVNGLTVSARTLLLGILAHGYRLLEQKQSVGKADLLCFGKLYAVYRACCNPPDEP